MKNGFKYYKKGNRFSAEILPEDILIDSSNLPELDVGQLEGRIENYNSRPALSFLVVFSVIISVVFVLKVFDMQILNGSHYLQKSRNNRISQSVVFADRGIIYDRNNVELAWNDKGDSSYSDRKYIKLPGLSHVLGFVKYPKADNAGFWWRTNTIGVGGAEEAFNATIDGTNGRKIVEVDSLNEIKRDHIIKEPEDGNNIILSIDSDIQSNLFSILHKHAKENGFEGGASIIVNIKTGGIIAMTSFPEYDSQVMSDGNKEEMKFILNKKNPFLNRVVSGLYTPGSIVKPIFATGALEDGIISPTKKILSTGSISIENPYKPGSFSVFRDWKAHGWVDMVDAIAVSSNVYFFTIGGGFGDQKGLGISGLDKWAKKFGLGESVDIGFSKGVSGTVPSPKWKSEVFEGEEWRIGDTYNTSIGQYGFQITPLQAVRYVSAIANGGTLISPHILKGGNSERRVIGVSDNSLRVVRSGMRRAVTSSKGSARSLNIQGMKIAAKTGTAQVGNKNQWMHSWSIGFWPYNNPKYAFATVLEKAPAGTLAGASPAMRKFFKWLLENKEEYGNPHD